MLHKISKNEYNRYVDFVYNLSHDLSKCSFPIYNDGVKTKEYFCEKSLKALDRDDEEILLYEKDGKAKGWIHFYFIQSDKYLGISCMLIEKDFGNALEELLEYWQRNFSGYTFNIYIPEENAEALSLLKRKGYDDLSREIVDVLLFKDYAPQSESKKVIQIDSDNFEIFRKIHSDYDNEMYWNSDRIKESLSLWEIFAYIEEGVCKGALYYINRDKTDLEIFGIDYRDGRFDSEVTEKLLISGLNKAKRLNANSMYFFNDKQIHSIAEKLGFGYITTAHFFEGVF